MVEACQRPPFAVGTPSSFSDTAMTLNDLPWACSSKVQSDRFGQEGCLTGMLPLGAPYGVDALGLPGGIQMMRRH
jgi:hypothetical protein